MNIDEIIDYVETMIALQGSKVEFSESLGIGINTLQHFKRTKEIKLSTLLKILNKLNVKIKLES